MYSLLIILGIIALAIIWGWIGRWWLKVRTRKIAEQRAGEGFTDFAAYFAGANIPIDILLHTYDYFEDCNSPLVENFPVRATDNIADIYGIVDEDLDDAVEEILQKSGHRQFSNFEQRQSPRIETVEDMVLYVASTPLSRQ